MIASATGGQEEPRTPFSSGNRLGDIASAGECQDPFPTVEDSWTPPTPPMSSSPSHGSTLVGNPFANKLSGQTIDKPLHYRSSPTSRTHRVSKPMPLRGSPSQHGPRQGKATSSPSGRGAAAGFHASGNDWHSRFTLQCAERARLQRQHGVNIQRNGLLGEIVRPGEETREELAVWKKMAIQQKQSVVQEANAVLEDEYAYLLHDLEVEELDSLNDSADMTMAEDLLDPTAYAEEQYEAYLASLTLSTGCSAEDTSMADT